VSAAVSRLMVALVVALGTSSASAQTLKEFLDAADTNNVDHRVTIEQRNKAAADFRAAWTAMLPYFTAQGSYTHNQYAAEASLPNGMGGVTKLVIQPADQVAGTFRFDLPLIDTTRWFRAAAADSAREGAQFRELVTRDLVRRQVAASYFGYAASLAVLQSARRSVDVAEAQLKLMEVRSSAGSSTELDLLRSKAEVARTRQTVADAVSLVATSKRTLRTLTGVEPADDIAIPADDVHPEADLASLEGRIEELPALKAAGADRDGANRAATLSKLAIVPIVGAQFTEQVTNATGFTGKATAFNTGLYFQWRLDVPTFMNMQSQDSTVATADLAIDRARLQARDQVNADYQRLTAALTKIDSARAQVEAARRAAQVAKDRYAAGVATQVDVIQAERDLFSAEVGQIQARTELATARASLHISAAMPLD